MPHSCYKWYTPLLEVLLGGGVHMFGVSIKYDLHGHGDWTWCVAVNNSTRVVTKINGHEDKQSSKLSNLNSVNSKIAETKQQNRLKQCFS